VRPRRGGRRREARRAAAVLIYGEDLSDTRAIAELIQGLAPGLSARIEPRREPLVLIRDAPVSEIARRAERIAAAVQAERGRLDVVCVFAHEDCDDFDSEHEELATRIEDALVNAGCPVHAVVPAWEIEAWWFLWPQAVQSVVPSWRRPDEYVGRNVGVIRDAKEALSRSVLRGLSGSARTRVRGYRGSDSPAIARYVREQGLARHPQGTSGSYDRFRRSVDACAG
jgi:hypothetical protein